MPIYTRDVPELLYTYLRKIYGDAYKAYPEEYSQFFEIDYSTRAYEEDHAMSSLGPAELKPEGAPVAMSTIYNGPTKRYTFATYGKGFQVTREMYEDDQFRKMKNMPKALAKSMRDTVEIVAANVLNNAFSTSHLGADGKPLCATDHPLLAGGTFSNTPTTPADLDITSYEQALIEIQEFLGNEGQPIAARPLKLIVSPYNEFNAKKILKSDRMPGTPNNDYNPAMNSMPGGIVVSHWLSDPDAWFITTDVPNGLTFIWRRKPEFTTETAFDTETAAFKGTMRFDAGFTDPRGIYGSPGV